MKDAPKRSQAQRIIAKFGSPYKLAQLLTMARQLEDVHARPVHASTVYRWTYLKSVGGSGGVIPTREVEWIKKVARLNGVFLTDADWAPEDR